MPTKQSEQELQEVSDLLVKWSRDFDHARPYFDEFMLDYLAYKFHRDPNSHPYKYNPSIPLVFTIAENLVSTVFNAFFSKDKTAAISPVEHTHAFMPHIRDEQIARQLETAVNVMQMHPDREFMLDKYDLDMTTVVFGTGITCTIPVFDNEQESDLGGPLYLGPRVIAKDVWDVIPDREGYRASNCRWMWEKEWISKEEYKERMENQGYRKLTKDELDKLVTNPAWMPDDYEFHDDVLRQLGKGAQPRDGVDSRNNKILLLHHYDTRSGHYKTLAGNRMVVRDSSKPRSVKLDGFDQALSVVVPPYPYNPYDDIRLYPFPREFYARGVGKVARGFQDEINLLKSMRLENIELGIHKVFLINEIFGLDEEDFYMIPGAVYNVRDVDRAVKTIDIQDVTRDAYTEEAMWQKEAQDATSSQEVTRGSDTPRRETATTVVSLQRNAMKRLESFIKRSAQWHRSVIMKQIIQIRTYMSQREYERIIGEPDAGFFQLDIHDIKRMFDITPASASIEQVKEIEQQNFVNAMQLMKGYEGMFNQPELAKLFFELFFPAKNPDKYVLQQQPMQPQMPGQPPQPGLPGGTGVGQPTISPAQLIQGTLDGSIGGSQGGQ